MLSSNEIRSIHLKQKTPYELELDNDSEVNDIMFDNKDNLLRSTTHPESLADASDAEVFTYSTILNGQ